MGTFFHGWRRKLGCVTLVLACVFTVGWVRSLLIGDIFNHVASKHIDEDFSSVKGFLSWDRFSYTLEAHNFPTRILWWHPKGRKDLPLSEINWSFCGISLSEHQWADHLETFLIIPYWTLVIPLTLLSAWLLLSKQRITKRNHEPKLTEPVAG